MKKVIEQEGKDAIRIEEGLVFDGIKISQHMRGVIYIEKSKAREVAKAIDPKYQETIDLNAKLLAALKNTIDHVLNRVMKIDIEATIELIHEAETKLKDNE